MIDKKLEKMQIDYIKKYGGRNTWIHMHKISIGNKSHYNVNITLFFLIIMKKI